MKNAEDTFADLCTTVGAGEAPGLYEDLVGYGTGSIFAPGKGVRGKNGMCYRSRVSERNVSTLETSSGWVRG
jgi:hypothetical protein